MLGRKVVPNLRFLHRSATPLRGIFGTGLRVRHVASLCDPICDIDAQIDQHASTGIGGLLQRLGRWDELGDKAALVCGDSGQSITYAQLPGRIRGCADALSSLGFGQGDVLGLHLPNSPEYAVAFLGTAGLGGTNTTSNPVYTTRELQGQLEDSGAKFLLSSRVFQDVAEAAAAGVESVEAVYYVEDEDCFVHADAGVGASLPKPATPLAMRDDLLVLPYSSGTTGKPKGVMLSHYNVSANVLQLTTDPEVNLGYASDDIVLGVLPFFHIYGMVAIMKVALARGCTIVTLPKFDAEQFLGTLQEHKVSFAPLVPPICIFLAKHPMVDEYDLSALKQIFTGAAPLDAETEAAVAARLGTVMRQGSGMTELSPVSHVNPTPDSEKPIKTGSIGLALPMVDCRIVDPETGSELGPNETGELWIQGPNRMVGYLNRPDATSETLSEDGYLKSGDVAYVDEDGYYYIVDRLKELIKVKGFQVAPAELEGLLLAHEAVADCAVLGVPDDRAGELPRAYVVLKANAQATENDIKSAIAGQVAEYKQLESVVFVEEIPKSASGKILKRVLRDQL